MMAPVNMALLCQIRDAGGGGGGGAPVGASYLVLGLDATLTAERVLVGTANQVVLTDGGAGGNLTLSLPQSIATTSSPTFVNGTFTGTMGITGVTTLSNQLITNQGSIVADLPAIMTTTTWNNAGVMFTGWELIVTDTASAATSLLIDLRVGAGSIFSVGKGGTINTAATGSSAAPAINFSTRGTNYGLFSSASTDISLQVGASGHLCLAARALLWYQEAHWHLLEAHGDLLLMMLAYPIFLTVLEVLRFEFTTPMLL
jgi:hypothetical protein